MYIMYVLVFRSWLQRSRKNMLDMKREFNVNVIKFLLKVFHFQLYSNVFIVKIKGNFFCETFFSFFMPFGEIFKRRWQKRRRILWLQKILFIFMDLIWLGTAWAEMIFEFINWQLKALCTYFLLNDVSR